jgi:hypothetical protein
MFKNGRSCLIMDCRKGWVRYCYVWLVMKEVILKFFGRIHEYLSFSLRSRKDSQSENKNDDTMVKGE